MKFSIFKKQKKIKGEIAYYRLEEWWLNTFSKNERNHIENVFHPLGTDSNNKPLTEGKIGHSSQNAAGLLSAVAGWFNKPNDRHIAKKIIEKANQLAEAGNDILDHHFALHQKIKIYYRERNSEPHALKEAIKACNDQIKIAPKASRQFLKEYPNEALPYHVGYSQLAIILKKQNKHESVIKLCQEAKKQGWADNWDKRIANAQKKLLIENF